MPSLPTRAARLLVAVAIGALCVLYWLIVAQRHDPPAPTSDFDQFWVAAKMLRTGIDPYAAIHYGTPVPGSHSPLGYAFFYPLPAVILVYPFQFFSIAVARALFTAVGFGVLTYALTRRGWSALIALMSAGSLHSLVLAQWSPYVAAAVFLPAMHLVGFVKPNAALAVVVGSDWRQRRGILIGLIGFFLLCAIAFLFQPDWPLRWVATTRGQAHFTPFIVRPWGWMLLAALPLWRAPAARWLLVTALLPATPVVYAALPLFVYEWSRKELLVLALLSHLAMWVPLIASARGGLGLVAGTDVAATALIWLLYLPAIGMLWRANFSEDAR